MGKVQRILDPTKQNPNQKLKQSSEVQKLFKIHTWSLFSSSKYIHGLSFFLVRNHLEDDFIASTKSSTFGFFEEKITLFRVF